MGIVNYMYETQHDTTRHDSRRAELSQVKSSRRNLHNVAFQRQNNLNKYVVEKRNEVIYRESAIDSVHQQTYILAPGRGAEIPDFRGPHELMANVKIVATIQNIQVEKLNILKVK